MFSYSLISYKKFRASFYVNVENKILSGLNVSFKMLPHKQTNQQTKCKHLNTLFRIVNK